MVAVGHLVSTQEYMGSAKAGYHTTGTARTDDGTTVRKGRDTDRQPPQVTKEYLQEQPKTKMLRM